MTLPTRPSTPPRRQRPLNESLQVASATSAVRGRAMKAVNDADFKAGERHHTVLRLRDLHLAPTPLFYAMLVCAIPLLMLGAAVEALESTVLGALMLVGVLGCLWHGIQTLRGLQLHCVTPLPCFAGDQAKLAVEVANRAGRSRWDIAMTVDPMLPDTNGWIDLAPRSHEQVLMSLGQARRGRQPLPRIRLETQHPFGLVRVNAYWTPRGTMLVVDRPSLSGGEPASGAAASSPRT